LDFVLYSEGFIFVEMTFNAGDSATIG